MNKDQRLTIGKGQMSADDWGQVSVSYESGDEWEEKSANGSVAVIYRGPGTYSITAEDKDLQPIIKAVFDRVQDSRDNPKPKVEVSDEIIEAAESRVSDIEIQLDQANDLLDKQRAQKKNVYAVMKMIQDEISACALSGEDVTIGTALGNIASYVEQLGDADWIMQQNNAEVWRDAYWQGVDDARQAEETGWEHQPHRVNPYDSSWA